MCLERGQVPLRLARRLSWLQTGTNLVPKILTFLYSFTMFTYSNSASPLDSLSFLWKPIDIFVFFFRWRNWGSESFGNLSTFTLYIFWEFVGSRDPYLHLLLPKLNVLFIFMLCSSKVMSSLWWDRDTARFLQSCLIHKITGYTILYNPRLESNVRNNQV